MLSGSGLVAKSCLTLVTPWTASPPGYSVHGILQARILEWVIISLLQGIFPTQGMDLGLPHWSFPGGSAGKECMFDRPLMFSILHELFLIDYPDAGKDGRQQ